MSNLEQELKHFYGSDTFYYLPHLGKKYSYTEGVKYLAENAEAYWLIEYIFLHQNEEALLNEVFQTWKISVTENSSAILQVEDGNKGVLKKFTIEYTSFPIQQLDLWFINNRLLLPSEY